VLITSRSTRPTWVIRAGVLLRYIEDGAAWWSAVVQRSDDARSAGGAPLRSATRLA
jgi:exopolyphosphatase/guanosine-5'-triphosphate,3'-diphosphate pyrophosphatase